MNIDTTRIVASESLSEEDMNSHIPIPARELADVQKMSRPQRKNWMRNKPCVCGSGKKFKRCCWGKI